MNMHLPADKSHIHALLFAVLMVLSSEVVTAAHAQQADAFQAVLQQKLKDLDAANPVNQRLEALRWINSNAAKKGVEKTMAELTGCCKDADAKVRKESLITLCAIALHRKMPCPLAAVEAWTDPDDDVRTHGYGYAGMFKQYPSQVIELLSRYADSKDPALRGNAVLYLGWAKVQDEKILDILRKARQDPHFEVRHNAHLGLYHATGDLDAFVPYLFQVQEGKAFADVPGKFEDWTEEQKQEQAKKNLLKIGVWGFFAGEIQKRPQEAIAYLLRLCNDHQPAKRLAAVKNLSAAITMLANAHLWEPASVLADQEQKRKPFDLSIFKKMKVVDAFAKLKDNDPDPQVRQAAQKAIDAWEKALKAPPEVPEEHPLGGWLRLLQPELPKGAGNLYGTRQSEPPKGGWLLPSMQRRQEIRDGTSNTLILPQKKQSKLPGAGGW